MNTILRGTLFMLIIGSLTSPALAVDITEALTEAENWGYQLQDINITELSNASHDVVVIDYSLDGSDATALSAQDVSTIRNTDKVVLSYLSIGEAEDYRFYWKNKWHTTPPGWLGETNPEWEGNYKVKYWKLAWWRTAVKPYLTRVATAEFDGVYLDIIDGYEYWGNQEYSKRKSAKRMAQLVHKIRLRLNSTMGEDAILCPQNGELIINSLSEKRTQQYLNDINCIGIEDLWYNTSKSDRKQRIKALQQYTEAGVTLFNIEYIPKKRITAYSKKAQSSSLGNVIHYRSHPNRALDTLHPILPANR